jgi:hypothetical protein
MPDQVQVQTYANLTALEVPDYSEEGSDDEVEAVSKTQKALVAQAGEDN